MEPNENPVNGPVEILIVTFGTPVPRVSGKVVSDLDWLRYCLKALRKFSRGFQGITIAHPAHERHLFDPLIAEFDVRLFAYEEIEGKGMLQHMAMMAMADFIVPPSTKYVMHLDADCIYHTPITPESYFCEDKPVYLIRSWDSLCTEDPRNPGSKVISDCHQWKPPTDFQIGMDTEWYTMCRHPTVMPIEFYEPYRNQIVRVHGCPFEQFITSGKNSHPQDRMDWTAMGAFARQTPELAKLFYWMDIGVTPAPRDLQQCYWSHGGITPEIRTQIEEFLSRPVPYVPTPEEAARMAT
jgi:hypothetical protein